MYCYYAVDYLQKSYLFVLKFIISVVIAAESMLLVIKILML